MSRLAALALLVLCACGGGSSPNGDAGPPDAFAADAFSCASCVAPTAICNTNEHRCDQCTASPDCASLPYTDVCVGGACRECNGDNDCTASSLGPTCDTTAGYCRCAGPSDCAGNSNGPVCDTTLLACTCTDSTQCGGSTTCQPQPYLGPGAKTCQ